MLDDTVVCKSFAGIVSLFVIAPLFPEDLQEIPFPERWPDLTRFTSLLYSMEFECPRILLKQREQSSQLLISEVSKGGICR